MRKFLKLTLIILIILVVVIQFIRPKKNLGEISADHILNKEALSAEITTILKNACLDCHSNQTRYLWYHQFAPVSFMINNHITNGKKELNFSEWGQLDVFDKIGALEKICREVEKKKMPIKAYTMMHKEARLSEEQIAALCAWTEKLSEDLLTSQIKK